MEQDEMRNALDELMSDYQRGDVLWDRLRDLFGHEVDADVIAALHHTITVAGSRERFLRDQGY